MHASHVPELDHPGRWWGDTAAFLGYAQLDWFVTKDWNRLHWASEFTPQQLYRIPELWGIQGPVRLACGRTAATLHIPGMFTRLSHQRCTGCCRATGLPPGKGSPKNDAACRVLLGLD